MRQIAHCRGAHARELKGASTSVWWFESADDRPTTPADCSAESCVL